MAEISLFSPLAFPQTSYSPADIVQIGRNALELEASAIKGFSEALGDEFVRAVNLLAQSNTCIVVTGVGKSGHVARKIAATLSSLDRRAIFVHPTEASHGDLGAIRQGDTLLALSNSGETAELRDIIAYCESLDIPIVSIVGNPRSTLAKRSQVVLSYGLVQEACSNGLAPTTSTTLALAVGDALSVAVMSVIGVTKERFGVLHPGGKLGSALARVSDLMRTGDQLPVVRPDQHMKEVVVEMTSKSLGVALVQEHDGVLRGVITDGDMRRHIDVLWHSHARDLLSMRPITVSPDMLVSKALDIMTERNITCVVVVDDQGKPLGLLHVHDCLRVTAH